MSSTSTAYRRLTGNDLKAFGHEARDLILEATATGCLGRITARGHCILRNNAGGSVTVSRTMKPGNGSLQNAHADVRRLIAGHRGDVDPPASGTTPQQQHRMTVARAFIAHGAAFSRWVDGVPDGVSPDQLIDVTVDESGQPVFAVPPAQTHPSADTDPTPEPRP